ncbi:selenoprotein O, partial [Caerostris extrusa]
RIRINQCQLQTFLAIASANPEIIEQLGRAGIAIKRNYHVWEKAESLKSMTEESKSENDRLIWTEWLNKYQARIEKDMQSYDGDTASYYKNRLEIIKANNPRYLSIY